MCCLQWSRIKRACVLRTKPMYAATFIRQQSKHALVHLQNFKMDSRFLYPRNIGPAIFLLKFSS